MSKVKNPCTDKHCWWCGSKLRKKNIFKYEGKIYDAGCLKLAKGEIEPEYEDQDL